MRSFVKLHPDLQEDAKGWQYSTPCATKSYGEDKEHAIRDRQQDIELGIKVGKLTYGHRRKIHRGYGYQRRFQESTSEGKLPESAIGNFNMEIFETEKTSTITTGREIPYASCQNPDCEFNTINFGQSLILKDNKTIEQTSCPECKEKTIQEFKTGEVIKYGDDILAPTLIKMIPVPRKDLSKSLLNVQLKKIKKGGRKYSRLWANERGQLLQKIGFSDEEKIIKLVNTPFDKFDRYLQGIIAKKMCQVES